MSESKRILVLIGIALAIVGLLLLPPVQRGACGLIPGLFFCEAQLIEIPVGC